MDTVTQEEVEKLYVKLRALTKSGALTWYRVSNLDAILPASGSARASYRCELDGKSWGLIEYSARAYNGELDEWYTDDGVQLSLLFGSTQSAYDFPFHYEIYALLDAVKAQSSGVRGVLDQILKK